ncbi:hypothetical protein FDP41_010899 [Naegleria fowleri]|uniref:phenylalanine 4-monooxygenase n=1 Tax=Naegleria fowleri TaxID=5763 RepID=A0A6A5CB99_NAEFO|nr:uncharacterized protein FDP41_010899 [Naegleria fowleri]KAF0982920.1 hypothetical protein FDP41_010899 [Naegleria fowleri]
MERLFPKFANPTKLQKTLLLSLPQRTSSLKNSLEVFSKHNVNLTKIESRPNRLNKKVIDFVLDVDENTNKEIVDLAIKEMLSSKVCENVKYLGFENNIPWFPTKISDIDFFTRECLEAGGELQSDHPGFHDVEYRERRKKISDIALNYKHGTPIPRIEYSESENQTWKLIYNKLTSLYPKYACEQYNTLFPLFEQNCGFSPERIPQLQDVSDFLSSTTGFKIRPVSGLLTARDFLNALAFRVFHSTQYIRHHSKPYYTPEPDVVHELLGHVVLLCDPDFAEFSQQIGLASLGASDAEIDRLVRLYWYTVEFGVVKEDSQMKAYGAGLLSSFGELEYSCTGRSSETDQIPQYLPFVPEEAAIRPYPITHYQPVYYVVQSLESCKDLIRRFVNNSTDRPFQLKYNPYTQTVDVLDSQEKLISLTKSIQNNLDLLKSSLAKMGNLKMSLEKEINNSN